MVPEVFDPVLLLAGNPGPMTGAGNNTYLIIGNTGSALLVDAGVGTPAHVADLAAALDARNARLIEVLVTHGHADHASGATRLAEEHPDIRFLKQPWPGQDEQFAVDWQPVSDGDVIRAGDDELIVVATPGHSPDHLSFWHAPSRTMFTGDLVALGTSVMIHASRGGNLADYMRSLERVLEHEPRVLLPAHGTRVEDPRALITGYLNHRREREQQVQAALRAGHATVDAIAESIYHDLSPALLPAARENVRAHLEKLRVEGQAVLDGGRWKM
ncbi:MAG TPA: MBL fold metallo-hydrolase [Vicinamibacterales bacterium]